MDEPILVLPRWVNMIWQVPSDLFSTLKWPSIRHSWQGNAGRFYCEIWRVGSFAGKSTCLAMVNKCWFRGTYRRRKKIKDAGLEREQAQIDADPASWYWKNNQENNPGTKAAEVWMPIKRFTWDERNWGVWMNHQGGGTLPHPNLHRVVFFSHSHPKNRHDQSLGKSSK